MMRLFTWRVSITCRPLLGHAHSMSNPGGFSRRKLILAPLRSHRFSLKNVCPRSLWPIRWMPKYDLPMPSAFVRCYFIQKSLLNNGRNCIYWRKPQSSKPSHWLDSGRWCTGKPRPPPVEPLFHLCSSPRQAISDLYTEHGKTTPLAAVFLVASDFVSLILLVTPHKVHHVIECIIQRNVFTCIGKAIFELQGSFGKASSHN